MTVVVQNNTVESILAINGVDGDVNLVGQDIPKKAFEIYMMKHGLWRRADKGRTGTHRSSGCVRSFGAEFVAAQSPNTARFMQFTERKCFDEARWILLRRAGKGLEKAAELKMIRVTMTSVHSNVLLKDLASAANESFDCMNADGVLFENSFGAVGLNPQDKQNTDKGTRVAQSKARMVIITMMAEAFFWIYYASNKGNPEGQEAAAVSMKTAGLIDE